MFLKMPFSKLRRLYARVEQLEQQVIVLAPSSVVYEWIDPATQDVIFSIRVGDGLLQKA